MFNSQQSGDGWPLLFEMSFWKGVVFSILAFLSVGYGIMITLVTISDRGLPAETDELLLRLWTDAKAKQTGDCVDRQN